MQIPFVDLQRQHSVLRDEIDTAMAGVVDSAGFIMGEELEHFEEEFARYCGAKYVVGTDSGLSALELGLIALGIGLGDSVLTPTNSFIASSSAISFTGARPLLVDMDPRTYNIDVKDAETRIREDTKGIMPVHLYGQPAEMDGVVALADKFSLDVIEDACQAHGAEYRGRKVGSIGNFAAFSFYPSKNLGAFGDGGAVVTNNEELAEKVRIMRNYGQEEKYNHILPAYNRRLDAIQAAVLRVKLKHLEEWNEEKRRIARLYDRLLDGQGIDIPTCPPYCTHVYHQYVIQHGRRDELRDHLLERGIGTGLHYPISIHLQPCYAELGYKEGDFPTAESAARRILSLPIYPGMMEEETEYVASNIMQFGETRTGG